MQDKQLLGFLMWIESRKWIEKSEDHILYHSSRTILIPNQSRIAPQTATTHHTHLSDFEFLSLSLYEPILRSVYIVRYTQFFADFLFELSHF